MPIRGRLHTLAATDAYDPRAGRTFGVGAASAFGAVLIYLSMQPSDGEVATRRPLRLPHGDFKIVAHR
jgi:hypothetical protein